MSLALASHWTLILSYLTNLFNSLYLTHINKTLAKTLLCGYLGLHCYNHMVLLRCIFSSVYRIIFSKLKGFLEITLSSNLTIYKEAEAQKSKCFSKPYNMHWLKRKIYAHVYMNWSTGLSKLISSYKQLFIFSIHIHKYKDSGDTFSIHIPLRKLKWYLTFVTTWVWRNTIEFGRGENPF